MGWKWVVFTPVAALLAWALLSPRPVTALPVAAFGIGLWWLIDEYPRSVLRKTVDEIDENDPDWPKPVPLAPFLEIPEEEN